MIVRCRECLGQVSEIPDLKAIITHLKIERDPVVENGECVFMTCMWCRKKAENEKVINKVGDEMNVRIKVRN